MKINPSLVGVNQGKAAGTNGSDRPSQSGSVAPGASSAPDTIHLSQLSTQLQALQSTLASGGEFDRAKVEAIKEAIRDGRLPINAEVVADRMLAAALAMMPKGG